MLFFQKQYMSKREQLGYLSRMRMVDSAKYWESFEPVGTIIIAKKAVFHDVPNSYSTQCFPFKNILALEYKKILVNFQGLNRELSGCVLQTTEGIRTLVCNIEVYRQIKETWMGYHA